MLNTTAALRSAIKKDGCEILVNNIPLQGLFDQQSSFPDPYMNDPGHDGPVATLLQSDLEAKDLYPLDASMPLTVANKIYRIVRADHIGGEAVAYLREG